MSTAGDHQIPHDEYDSPWKEILERYFKEFLAFFFPVAHDGIDWSKGHEFLEKELQQIARDAELGRRLVDKLVNVSTIEGDETWVLVHVEVQGSYESDFAERMYVYNYRLFDRYRRQVVSLAVLTGRRKRWRPKQYRTELWGCEARFTFPSVKLLDYAKQENELTASSNPFAIVVLAHLKTQATRTHPEDRLQWKLRLFTLLYERGYRKEDMLELMRFIDWVMTLPEELETRFDEAVFDYEEEHRMHYVTSFERYGLKKGRQEGRQEGMQEGMLKTSREAIVDILQLRFERVPASLHEMIEALDDPAVLKQLHRDAVTVRSLDDFAAILDTHSVAA